jgi:glyoxylase-like metal-dependent hydrolase (beta-lactamase superfamily II)
MTAPAVIEGFFDTATATVSYVVSDPATRRAAVIDPVLDYDARSGATATRSIERIAAYVAERGLGVEWILETHVHADHFSGAHALKARLGGHIGIGERVCEVQARFAKLYNLAVAPDARAFDHLFADGETFRIGDLDATVMAVPGHTPADVAYRVDGAVFVGDTLFMPDVGSARADFPGGDARMLYRSVRLLLALPDATAIYVCHDYPPAAREAAWQTSVADQRAHNVHVRDGIDEDAFVAMREARDATLAAPVLMLPALQVNVAGGRLPAPEGNGIAYLKLPLDALPTLQR